MSIKAAIDIGTNSTRLLVAQLTDRQTKDLHREARITRLGQNVDKTKFLAPEAIKRTADVVLDYVNLAKKLGAESIIIGATSAARDAKNIDSFISEVKAKTGHGVKILSPEQEASLSFLGATSTLACPPKLQRRRDSRLPTLVLDIGGGSTELILGTEIATRPSDARNGHNDIKKTSLRGAKATKQSPIKLAYSKDIGSVRLHEMFIKSDPPPEDNLDKAADYIEQIYKEPVSEIKSIAPTLQMFGTAGTTTTLAALNLGLVDYDSDKVHGSTLNLQSIEKLFNKLKKMTVAERKAISIIQPGRADVIVTGSLILLTLMRMLEVKSLIVSEKDILDGLLLTY